MLLPSSWEEEGPGKTILDDMKLWRWNQDSRTSFTSISEVIAFPFVCVCPCLCPVQGLFPGGDNEGSLRGRHPSGPHWGHLYRVPDGGTICGGPKLQPDEDEGPRVGDGESLVIQLNRRASLVTFIFK